MKRPNALIQILSLLCIILGSFALSIFYLTSWANALIFDTNYYLSIVTPLPQNTDIANAMSTYTVDTVFTNTDIEKQITNALPDKAKFLSPTLTDNLQNKSYKLTTTIIQSDQFESVWVAVNTLFHKRLLNIFRGGGILSQFNDKQFLQGTSLQFDGSQLLETIKSRLGSESGLITNQQIQEFKSLTVPLYTKLEKIRQIVYWISQLATMLLPVSLALILYGIAISFSRQKAILVAGIFIAIFMIITLVCLEILKTDLLNHITQSVYNTAANVVWDAFLEGLKQSLRLTLLGSLILILFAFISGPYDWSKNFRKAVGISQIQKSGFMIGFMKFRLLLKRSSLWLYLLGVLIVAITLLTLSPLTISTVVIIFSFFLLYLALLSFLFPRQQLH